MLVLRPSEHASHGEKSACDEWWERTSDLDEWPSKQDKLDRHEG
jgi:hypothetical protein